MRLDAYLVETGAVRSRDRAKDAIKAGRVRINGAVAKKGSAIVPEGADVACEGETHDYVSRGALKLVKGLGTFGIDPAGKVCLDLGASTGGFTEVLLRGGAAKVFAVDVGHGQLHSTLLDDERVVNLEKTHAKDLTPGLVPDPIDLIVCDVSFIGLAKALPPAMALARPGALMIALVKPQFEVGPDHIGKGGIVSLSPEDQRAFAETQVIPAVLGEDWALMGLTESPIKGGDGNTEFLMGAQRET